MTDPQPKGRWRPDRSPAPTVKEISSPMQQRRRYLIGPGHDGASSDLETLARNADGFPGLDIVKTVGDPQSPDLLVAEATRQAIEAVRAQFASRLVIERDAPLQRS